MESLEFLDTFSVEQFKAANPGALKVGHVDGRSGKCLLLNGKVIGAVSTKLVAGDELAISKVKGAEGTFMLLHKQGGGSMIIDEVL